MIELSLIDIALLVWAGVATAGYMHERDGHKHAKQVIIAFVEDKEVRDRILADYEAWQKKNAT